MRHSWTPTALNVNPLELGLSKGKSKCLSFRRESLASDEIRNDRANASLREHIPIFDTLGFLDPSLERRKAQLAILNEKSDRGRARRRRLMDAIDETSHEFQAQGSDLGQQYESSAIFLEGAGQPPKLPSDPVLFYEPRTFPGRRLPHAWLNTSVPSNQVSTLDLSGKGRFTIFTGHGGEPWLKAAAQMRGMLGVEVTAYAVGFGLEYEAVYNDWYRLREVEEDGCVLVRPDNFVAWRSQGIVDDCSATLERVLKKILSL